MRRPVVKLGPMLWALCACLVLLAHAAVAGESSVASGATRALVSHLPLQHVDATDLDGQDRDPDEELTGGAFGLSVLPRTSPTALPDDAPSAVVPPCDSACPAPPAIQPFSARPPPAHHHPRLVRRRL
jgi:hypothetical protein